METKDITFTVVDINYPMVFGMKVAQHLVDDHEDWECHIDDVIRRGFYDLLQIMPAPLELDLLEPFLYGVDSVLKCNSYLSTIIVPRVTFLMGILAKHNGRVNDIPDATAVNQWTAKYQHISLNRIKLEFIAGLNYKP